MTLEAGARLGHYEIVEPIGAGGMGEVYKATDTRLDRTVAVKILPEHLAESGERRQRFAREAKAISQLNHPNICTLHDVGNHEGIDFLVMEYIEGETLAARLKKGALPLDKALEYAVQICAGLDAAHRAGIVHRDLKPANAMLTKAGIKILDFGLAKLFDTEPTSELSDAPTRQKDLTREQAIVGTLPYMAPEQLEGKSVDARGDIWALGAILYEMLTGVRPFRGETQASLISSIMNATPTPVSSTNRRTPPALDYVVSTCLAKDCDERWQSAGDVGRQLKGIAREPSLAREASPRGRSWAIPALVAFALGAVAAWVLRPDPHVREPVSSHFDIGLPGKMDFSDLPSANLPIAISGDGRSLVFLATVDGTRRLYLRHLDSFEARALNGTEGATNPFFSPNGQWIGFHAGSSLQKVSVEGGAPLEITSSPAALFGGATWTEDDTIVFAYQTYGPLYRVSSDGGEAVPLTALKRDEFGHQFPTPLPGGKDILFNLNARDGWFAAVASLETGEHRRMAPAPGWVWFLPPGYLVYGQSGGLFAVPFDLDALEVRGGPRPVLDDVLTGSTANIDVANFAVSESGSLVYVPGGLVADSLVWVDRRGNKTLLTRETGRFAYPSLSPDGEQLAVSDNGDTWVYDLDGRTRTRLTSDGRNFVTRWSRDGRRVVYSSLRSGAEMNLHEQFTDGGMGARLLLDRIGRQYPITWTPDGSELLFFEVDARSGVGGNIFVWSPSGSGEPTPVLATEFKEWSASLSPDGRFLAYASNATGRNEVYIQPYPGPGRMIPVSTEGGTEPLWSPDGRELFYRNGSRVMLVDVIDRPSFSVSTPRLLFEGSFSQDHCCGVNYDIHSDGERFVMIEEAGATASRIHVITNWNEDVKRRVDGS